MPLSAPSSVVLEMDTCPLWIISTHSRARWCSFWKSHPLARSHFIHQKEQGPPSTPRISSSRVCVSICQGARCSLAVQMSEGNPNLDLMVLRGIGTNFSHIISPSAPTRCVLEALQSEGVLYFWQQLRGGPELDAAGESKLAWNSDSLISIFLLSPRPRR